MELNIDANSRAPLCASTPALHSPRRESLCSNQTESSSRESVASSQVSFRSVPGSQAPLVRCGNRGDAHLHDVDHELRIWSDTQQSMVKKLGNKVKTKLSKLRQYIARDSNEDREARLLLRTCHKSLLATRVQKASDVDATRRCSNQDCSLKVFDTSLSNSPPGSCPALTPDASSDSTPYDSRNGSFSSIPSILSYLSLRRSSTTALEEDFPQTPLRQRRISLPLEYDPNFHPRQLGQRLESERHNSLSSNTPVFNMPRWQPPSPDDCKACAIIRVVAHPTIGEEGNTFTDETYQGTEDVVPYTRVLRRLSDEKGNHFIEEIQDTDRNGKKKVLLQWGPDVDTIISQSTDDCDEPAFATGGALSSLLSSRCKSLRWLIKDLRTAFKDGSNKDTGSVSSTSLTDEADLLWERYP